VDFRREPWRKLYVRENLDHAGWPLLARGLRDYLIRMARDDGTLLAITADPGKDLASAVGACGPEIDETFHAVSLMLRDGYLVHDKAGRLSITRFEEAQARSTSTNRVRKHRESLKSETFPKRVTKQQGETETKRNETKRNETKRKRAKGPMPPDWKPSGLAWKRAAKANLDVADEEGEFREWTSAGGYTYADWDAAFLSHLRRQAKRAAPRARARAQTPAEAQVQRAIRLRAEEESA
jgi:hypothetical protein